MKKTRAELDAALKQLEEVMPKVIADTDESNWMDAFAGEADEIEESASAEDKEHVRARLNCILASNGLIPGESEGESCA